MAETLGSLYDKLSITKARFDAIAKRMQGQNSKEDLEKLVVISANVRQQRQELYREIQEFEAQALGGNKPIKLEEPKYKIYQGESSSGVGFDDLEDAIFHLERMNRTLWDLEDARRDKTKNDKEVRDICDEVAKFNRLRNDTVDEINRLFNEQVKFRKNQQ